MFVESSGQILSLTLYIKYYTVQAWGKKIYIYIYTESSSILWAKNSVERIKLFPERLCISPTACQALYSMTSLSLFTKM